MSLDIKFCPQCGSQRTGPFCGGCGLHYLTLALNGEPAKARAQSAPIEDEDSLPSLPPGLHYGEAFEPDTDCPNCGSPLAGATCELCGEETQ